MRTTLHMLPEEDWTRVRDAAEYRPASLDSQGFVHCTDGYVYARRVADTLFKSDPRPYVVLTIDLDANTAPWRFDDEQEFYPHIYGPVLVEAVVRVEPMVRAADGSFIGPSEEP